MNFTTLGRGYILLATLRIAIMGYYIAPILEIISTSAYEELNHMCAN